MKRHKEYHGWLIEVASEPTGYSFHCWLPRQMIGVSDRQIYRSSELALQAAQDRANLEVVRLALEHCYVTYSQGALEWTDYVDLVESIMQVCPQPCNQLSFPTA